MVLRDSKEVQFVKRGINPKFWYPLSEQFQYGPFMDQTISFGSSNCRSERKFYIAQSSKNPTGVTVDICPIEKFFPMCDPSAFGPHTNSYCHYSPRHRSFHQPY